MFEEEEIERAKDLYIYSQYSLFRKAPQTGRHPRQQTTEKQPRSNRAGKIQEGAAIIAPEIYG